MSIRQFQESITQELNVVKNRVRNLIGDAHWGEEGRYKEAILKNIIRKFLPNNLSVGTGFILNNNNQQDISRQLDIIIYENSLPVLFSEGDFIVTTLKNVRGIIEVKSKITPNTISDVIEQFDNSIESIRGIIKQRRMFLGVFSFEFEGNIENQRIDNSILESEKIINHISLGSNYFVRKWKHADAEKLHPPVNCASDFYNVYEIENLSFSYFISNLLSIATPGGLKDRYWFSFPIQGTKEENRLRTVCLNENNA
ncbi:DUF6602 domain-containing protein [Desulfolithobacter sp.]